MNKYRACLIGGAIGDAMGMPVERLSREQILIKYNGNISEFKEFRSHKSIKPAGQPTDDLYLCMLTAKSIIENEGINIQHMTDTLIDGLNYPFSITGTTRKALEIRQKGGDPQIEIKGGRHGGCGSAVRMPALALYNFIDNEGLIKQAQMVSKITHQENDAVAGSVAVALMVAWALRGDLNEYLSHFVLHNIMAEMNSDLRYKFAEVDKLLRHKTSTIDGIIEIGAGANSLELIPSAIFAFLRSPNNYAEAILSSVNAGGDTDSRAAIAGYISGAHNGLSGIPAKWINNIHDDNTGLNKDTVFDYSDKLYELFIKNYPIPS